MELPVKYDDVPYNKRYLVREEYIRLQNNKCYWCGGDLQSEPSKEITDLKINWNLFPPGFLKHPIHLQHCHKTGMTEGAVHVYCNAVMWQYEGR